MTRPQPNRVAQGRRDSSEAGGELAPDTEVSSNTSVGDDTGPGSVVEIRRPMPASVTPQWPGAMWVGHISEQDLRPGGSVYLHDAASYAHARLLVKRQHQPTGFVEVDIRDDRIDASTVLAHIASIGVDVEPRTPEPYPPPISVVVCTRDRVTQLLAALDSILRLDYPDFEVVVVDNNPLDRETARAVAAVADPRVRLVEAPLPGLARARNVGVRAARHELMAFTDDDVIVDRDWLNGIAHGLRDSATGCVTGMAASGEINTPSQWYFDQRVAWASSCVPTAFAINAPPPDSLFPFRVGSYGTGANFAVRRSLMFDLGGFDEGLGSGSRAGGGEDIDIFVRVLLAGHVLRYEPSALVWHRHRSDLDSLESQLGAYGRGLGAWLTKLMVNPTTLRMVLSRALSGYRRLRTFDDVPLGPREARLLTTINGAEKRALLSGPIALALARLSGRRARPLHHEQRRVALDPRTWLGRRRVPGDTHDSEG